MNIVTILGARPQFIKAAAVSRVLCRMSGVQEAILHTGQHYDQNMSDVFFNQLSIPRPDYHLGVGSGSHGAQTGAMLARIEQILLECRPDWVLVYGDTNTTLAGTLAAAKLHIPVAHVEAGLRSFNRQMPEEINRILTDHASDLLFTPTSTGEANLRNEGIAEERIHCVGDVMYDAWHFYLQQIDSAEVLEGLGLTAGAYVLATVHRAENTDSPERLATIAAALTRLSKRIPVALPLHPRTRKALEKNGLWERVVRSVTVLPPQGYLEMVALEKHARLIATDSGGVQKEACFARVPCVTLRDETEWIELIEAGWNRLAPPHSEHELYEAMSDALEAERPRQGSHSFYGNGDAANRISVVLTNSLNPLCLAL